jgi:hypothetical protein
MVKKEAAIEIAIVGQRNVRKSTGPKPPKLLLNLE